MSATRPGPSSWSTLQAWAAAIASARSCAEASIASTACTGSPPSSSKGDRSQATASSSGSVVGALMPPGYASPSGGQRPARAARPHAVDHERQVAAPRVGAAVLLLRRASDPAHDHRDVVDDQVVAQRARLLRAADELGHRL